jgi:O-antigen biosynthesis protein
MEATESGSATSRKSHLWYDTVCPEVSIIVLNFNKSELTAECLRHIWTHTRGRRYEIIVVDNGSSPGEFRALAELPGDFRLIRLPINRFFGEGNNIGAEESRGKYIVLLNNDAFVTDNWLPPMIDVLEARPRAGGVGPKFLYPDGRLQEAGAVFDEQGVVLQRGKLYAMDPTESDHIGIVDYCSAACFVTTRAIFDRVSGFDPSFEPAYYEDADLCFKIMSLGLFIYYCPYSVIDHMEHATTSSLREELGLKTVVDINRVKFLARWGDYLSARASNGALSLPTTPRPRLRADASVRSMDLVAVFYTPYELMPGGRERYLLTAAAALTHSHRVYVACEARYSGYRLDYLERDLSLDLSRISTVTRSELREVGSIDVFFHLGNHAFPRVPPQGRRNFHLCQFPFPGTDQQFADLWGNLRGYDCILVYSQFTRDTLCGEVNAFQFDVRMEILAPPVPIAPLSMIGRSRSSTPPLILSIGRFFAGGHNKRQDILIEAVRALTEAGTEVELHLVGALHPQSEHLRLYAGLRRQAEGLPVQFHANASSAILQDLLSRATIYWHATGFGVDPRTNPEYCEHFGISVVEAMAAGCVPFVVSNGGPLEFVREEETGFQYSTLGELVMKTQAVLRDRAWVSAASERVRHEAERFSEFAFKERWRKIAGV